ncbi:asparagine synthase (glutamine-hydrolyzing) [Nocardioides sp. KR10-350]|uniref:asparagine synthase (glutamine-hydrolyzing) n=1 Tax=Nocardioides cheoyonin TaxID=3156615 RepID=UPI0032B5B080
MCGVAGAFQQQDGKQLVTAMTERLAHRGPDAGGVVELVTPRAAMVLGHRRLSIIDPTAGADQPFCRDGLALVYNGELYNFRALRAELEGRGVAFTTTSDTEVVLEAWRAWGPAALARFRGMFALAVYDERAGSVTLARDGLGIKPLYVLPRGEGVVFASELKALATAVGEELRVDPASMVASILYYWVPPQHCSLQGVSQLPAGTWETHHADGRTERGVFWDPVEEAARAAASATPDLRAVIEESVIAHLVADVPVASFLSGGLDSSIVTALAHDQDPSIEAWTIAFRAADQRLEAMPDDAFYARRLADHLGIRLHEIELHPDVTQMLPRMVEVLDEPIGDPAAINTFLMCEAARDAGVKVLLSGMGADELFGGYRKHLACLIAARYRRAPAPLRRGVRRTVDALPVAAGGRGLRTVRWAQRFCSFADLAEEEAFRRSYTLYDGSELRGLVDPDLGASVDALLDEHAATYADHPAAFDGDDEAVNRMCLADARLFMQGLNLTYTDRASMAASTEVRVPFVDREVFAAAFAMKGRDKVRGRTQKAALKDAARAWIPAEIIDRPKASFGAPLRAWVTHDLREQLDDVLVGGELVSSGFLRADAVHRLVTDQRTSRRDTSKQLWQLLSLELWYRQIRTAGVSS